MTQHSDAEGFFASRSQRGAPWVSVPEKLGALLERSYADGIEAELRRRFQSRGELKPQDVEYISKLKIPLVRGDLLLSDALLERLRALCSLWEVDFRPLQITSHRKYIGAVIVRAKRLVFPVLKMFMKDPLRRQRDFNSHVVATLAELASEVARLKSQAENLGTPPCESVRETPKR